MKKSDLLTDDQINELAYEQAIERLEKVVNELETGEIPLELSIDLYQEGMKLVNRCQKKLDNVELKIEEIIEKNGEVVKIDFDYSEDKE